MIAIAMLYQRINNINPLSWCSKFFVCKIIHCHLNQYAQIESITIAKTTNITVDPNFFD